MADWDLVHRFAEEYAQESEDVEFVLRASAEQGVRPISRVLGQLITQMAASIEAKHIVEVGTGVGVSTVRLAQACPEAHITSIDHELDYHLSFRELLPQLDIDANRLRLITEDALEVLPKMNEASYDFVLIDVPATIAQKTYLDAVALCRPGGTIVLTGVLADGEVANPANRSAGVVALRDLLKTIAEDDLVDHALVPAAEGLIWARVHEKN